MRLLSMILIVFHLALASTADADEPGHSHEGIGHQHGSHPECPLPKTAMDVIRCASARHPLAMRAALAAEHSKSLVDIAGRRPNPELDLEAAVGSGKQSSTDVGLAFPIEWGGKRSSRIRAAEAEIAQTETEMKTVQAQVIRAAVVNLHRLRQLDLEKKFLSDTVATLQQVITQQSARPALSPEQQVTLSVFRMSLADARLKESALFDQEREIEHYFHVSTGHSLAELRPVLPKSPEKWPEFEEDPHAPTPSVTLSQALAGQTAAQAGLSAAESESWPSLRIGPLFKIEEDDRQRESLFGIKLMMDVPVFDVGGGGRAHARAGLLRADKLVQLARDEEAHERAEQLKVYRSAVKALRDAPTLEAIERDFTRNQGLARRGLVSGAILIELNRQRSDLIQSRNDRELKALAAQWEIYEIDGRIFTETL